VEGRRKKDRYDLLSPANSVSPPCTPTALAFIHLFPFHGSPSNPPPSANFLLLAVASRSPALVGTSLALRSRPLCSAPSLKVTDCLLYYPLVSIFTLLSPKLERRLLFPRRIRTVTIRSRRTRRCTDHCRDVIAFCSHCGIGAAIWDVSRDTTATDRRITRLGFVPR